MNTNSNPRISRNDAVAEYPSLIEGKTVWEWNGQLWTGFNGGVQGHSDFELTPLTDKEREYLTKRNALPKIHN